MEGQQPRGATMRRTPKAPLRPALLTLTLLLLASPFPSPFTLASADAVEATKASAALVVATQRSTSGELEAAATPQVTGAADVTVAAAAAAEQGDPQLVNPQQEEAPGNRSPRLASEESLPARAERSLYDYGGSISGGGGGKHKHHGYGGGVTPASRPSPPPPSPEVSPPPSPRPRRPRRPGNGYTRPPKPQGKKPCHRPRPMCPAKSFWHKHPGDAEGDSHEEGSKPCPPKSKKELADEAIAALYALGYAKTADYLKQTGALLKIKGRSTLGAPTDRAYMRLPSCVWNQVMNYGAGSAFLLKLMLYQIITPFKTYHDLITDGDTIYSTLLERALVQTVVAPWRGKTSVTFRQYPLKAKARSLVVHPNLFCNELVIIHGVNNVNVPPHACAKPPSPTPTLSPPPAMMPPPAATPACETPPPPANTNKPPPAGSPNGCPTPGGAHDDPHINGGHGQKFDFMGQGGNTYCLLSDTNLHVNVELTPGFKPNTTYMSAAGFLYHTQGETVEIVVNASSVKRGKAEGTLGQVGVQGELLPNSPLNFTRFDKRVFLQRHQRSVRIFLADALDLLVELVPYAKGDKHHLGHPPFINLRVRHIQINDAVHISGVLGQTYQSTSARLAKDRSARGKIGEAREKALMDGAEDDYRTSGLLMPDCTFSLFKD